MRRNAKSTVPMTCETPLHTIDSLRDAIELEVVLGGERLAVHVDDLRHLLRDAQTLHELVTRASHDCS